MKPRSWQLAACIAVLGGALLACKKGGAGGTPGGSASAAAARAQGDGVLTVSQEQQASWIRNFNPFLAENTSRWPTRSGVYEPLLIFNTVKGEYVPWLATSHEWADANKTLRLKTRAEVKWSDGQPFSANDVAFTFNLLKKFPALDLYGVWKFLETVRAPDPATVEFAFKEVYVPGLFYIGLQPIVPEHKWKDVPNPVTFKNETPVGTGPFTEVLVFQNQVYELGPNPHYWQKGKPAVKRLRFPAFPSNDQANLALLNGEVDWAANFVPDIEKVFVGKNPQHHHYWFPLVGGTVMLYANAEKKPFDDVRLRKAISMAIDRPQIVKVAMYNYTRPADATALSDAFKAWRNPEALAAEDWTKLDLAKANALLDSAGYTRGANGIRLAAGKPITLQIIVPTGWSDWIRGVQIIVQNLKQVGIEAALKTYDFSAWLEKVQKGDFDGAVGWSVEGPTPYIIYRALMATETMKPLGEASNENWHRYGKNQEVDQLLKQFENTADLTEQRAIANKLQAIFVQNAPAIPLFYSPVWGEYNDKRIIGFPNKENPYARLSTFPAPEYLLVLTELKPRGK
jgi:peptide/nickel transport system substrate-binding protein